jgi:hypothetical protein
MTAKQYQALGIYCAVAMIALTRLHTGNLWLRLSVSLIVFILVPAAALRSMHRPQGNSANGDTPA